MARASSGAYAICYGEAIPMSLKLAQRLLCVVGRHKRRGRTVHFDGDDYVSNCRHCGIRMVRHNEVWKVERTKRADAEAAPAPGAVESTPPPAA